MKRILMVVALAATALGLAGCATLAAGGLAAQAEAPAVVAIEAGFAQSFHEAADRVDAGVAIEEAGEIGRNAAQLLARVSLARFAYDATIGSSAPLRVQHQVAIARAETDAAFERLARKLAQRGAPPPI